MVREEQVVGFPACSSKACLQTAFGSRQIFDSVMYWFDYSMFHLFFMMPVLEYSTRKYGNKEDVKDSFLSPLKVQAPEI